MWTVVALVCKRHYWLVRSYVVYKISNFRSKELKYDISKWTLKRKLTVLQIYSFWSYQSCTDNILDCQISRGRVSKEFHKLSLKEIRVSILSFLAFSVVFAGRIWLLSILTEPSLLWHAHLWLKYPLNFIRNLVHTLDDSGNPPIPFFL